MTKCISNSKYHTELTKEHSLLG